VKSGVGEVLGRCVDIGDFARSGGGTGCPFSVVSPLSVFGWKWGGGGAKGWGMLVEVAENSTFLALAGDLIVKSNPTAKSQPCFAATYDKSR
jgi:hypothetical protein